MPKRHGAREQKKAAKQKSKRDARRKQLARASSPNPMVRLKHAADWPIVGCMVPDELWETGLGQLVFARRMPDGQIAIAVFLVDVFCLGVKNVFWQIGTRNQYDAMVKRIAEHEELREVSPEYLSKLVHCAADYAQSLGFAPHGDFRHARLLLAGIDPSRCSEEFTFGQNGVPLYIRGPGESIEKARAIVAQVEAVGGHYVMLASSFMADPEFELLDEDEGEDEFEDDEDYGENDNGQDENVIDV